MINIRAFLGLSYYTSSLDQFLKEYNQAHPRLSASQRVEKEKFDKIAKMRDNPHYHAPKASFWDKF